MRYKDELHIKKDKHILYICIYTLTSVYRRIRRGRQRPRNFNLFHPHSSIFSHKNARTSSRTFPFYKTLPKLLINSFRQLNFAHSIHMSPSKHISLFLLLIQYFTSFKIIFMDYK